MIEAEIEQLMASSIKKETEIMQLNQKILSEISQYYEKQWAETMLQVASSFAQTKTQYYRGALDKLAAFTTAQARSSNAAARAKVSEL